MVLSRNVGVSLSEKDGVQVAGTCLGAGQVPAIESASEVARPTNSVHETSSWNCSFSLSETEEGDD